MLENIRLESMFMIQNLIYLLLPCKTCHPTQSLDIYPENKSKLGII